MNIDYCELQKLLNQLTIKKEPKTFLDVVDKSFDEIMVSKYLTYLLDERNTCKSILRQIITKTSSSDDTINFVELLDSGIFECIESEEQIAKDSRLDIIIKYSTFWLVIENKILASESKPKQTLIYEKELKKSNLNKLPIKFIYLKPKFNKSKPSNPHFTELTYEDIMNVLENVSKEELQEPNNYQFLQDFIKHIRRYFMNKTQSILDEQALKFYYENKDKIDYIINTHKEENLRVQNLLVNSITESFPTFMVHSAPTYIQIYKQAWQPKGVTSIHFEILTPKGLSFYNLIDKTSIKLTFAIHNEKSTKEMYPELKHQTLYSKEFKFNTNENIQNSIEVIIQEIQTIINRFEEQIDKIIDKKS